ncbi:LuxR C-terminal-related transcriptional regulator [Chamaesiphon sp. OTE_8_metabat_110]|uniref:LuxR C-terminal-related transcriptional regulator n=1 Tax=Chamaesiphon sp. OTE_8_metabat_110 TaxID=2964696 RepID=UPI00286BFC0C|nr:LuxR C-terminal-related transcriptional regulator [Chamaesiphon sp. OTE_8_metabat_110]
MTDPVFEMVDGTKLLVDLQQVNAIVTSFSGCLVPAEIACRVTNGLVEKFGCVFARIWLMEPERTALKLVASSGLYQRTDGFFARVPVGAFKVGKIAQNQIPFLSNQLAAESWVLDREWAISHGIQGFAGYPLIVDGDSIGVLAVFSQAEMLPEFLEILQSLCTATTIGLAAALRYQQEKLAWRSATAVTPQPVPLSEQIATVLKPTQLALVGTERALPTPLHNLFVRAAAVLSQLPCHHSRLTYQSDRSCLEAVIAGGSPTEIVTAFDPIKLEALCLGGTVTIQPRADRSMLRVVLTVIFAPNSVGGCVNLRCRSSLLQMAFSHQIELAGLSIAPIANPALPLITDDRSLVTFTPYLIWIATDDRIPPQARAKIDLSINPIELRSTVDAILRGESGNITTTPNLESPPLSEREREIINLLCAGLRDRDIAARLIVSESTVKFHINNILTKLKAKTRFQALYQAMIKGLV